MRIIGPLIGGFVGGIIGAYVWAMVAYYTNFEIGWIACGVGLLVGFWVRYVAYVGHQEANKVLGFLSAGVAICSIFFAKYLVFAFITNDFNSNLNHLTINDDEQLLIATIADEIVEQRIKAGVMIQWPPNMTAEEASAKVDYPPQIWQEAEKEWNKLTVEDREQRKTDLRDTKVFFKKANAPKFIDVFSVWDILWFSLATITAFKIGIGTYMTIEPYNKPGESQSP